MTAINSSNKDTDRSSRTAKLRTCLSLVENSIAAKGPRRVFIRIKGPDGILLTSGQEQIFTFNGEQMIYSASREVDYQGEEIDAMKELIKDHLGPILCHAVRIAVLSEHDDVVLVATPARPPWA